MSWRLLWRDSGRGGAAVSAASHLSRRHSALIPPSHRVCFSRPPRALPFFTGKTTLIDTVMAGKPGVLLVNVAPGATLDKVVGDTLKAVTRCECACCPAGHACGAMP